MSDVTVLARWTGWCDPCETQRPLVLTETGERGVRAWMRGVGTEDRELTLTCGVCGEWQSVPHQEDDDLPDESTVPSFLTAFRPLGARQVVVRPAGFPPYPVESVPAPRSAVDRSLDLLAEGFDLVGLAS